jgi:hypothetical protein
MVILMIREPTLVAEIKRLQLSQLQSFFLKARLLAFGMKMSIGKYLKLSVVNSIGNNMNKRFEDMTLEELEAREFVINDMLKEIGEKYESLSGLEYTDVNGEMYNTKQMIGDRISSLYSALGTIYSEIGKRTDQ